MPRIEHFAIFAADPAVLRDFYVDVLKMKVIVDNSLASTPGYFLADDAGMALEVIGRPADVPVSATRYVCHSAFLVENYDEARADLVRRGIAIEADTEVDNASMRTAFFNDPEGNRCQIVWRAQPLGT